MNCKNCEIDLDINDKFCAQCGAQVVNEKLTIKKVLFDFSERYLSFDNKFLITFKTLFTHPERVITGYLNGLRVRYVNPITYLIIAVTLSGFNIVLMKRGYLGNIDYNAFSGDQKAPFDMKEFMNTVYDYNSILIFFCIPYLALLSKLVFYNYKQFNYAEHNLIYFYTYSQSSIFVLLFIPFLIIFKLDFYSYSLFTVLFMLVYHSYALKKVFNLSGKQLIVKTLLFIPIGFIFYIILSIILMIVFLVYLVSSGKFNLDTFAQ